MRTLGFSRLAVLGLLALIATGAVTTQGGPEYRPTVVVQIGVADLDRSIRFYEEVMGFTLVERRNDLQFAHIQTRLPGLQLGLSVGSTKSGTGAAIINIGVADTDAARRLLESKGVKFDGPTQVIPRKVALAGFTDPDGNQFRLAGPAPKQ